MINCLRIIFVESIQEVSSEDQVMYRLNNVIVSGLHSLVFNDKLIHVKDHPEAKKIDNYNKKVLYCFNCSKKKFRYGWKNMVRLG